MTSVTVAFCIFKQQDRLETNEALFQRGLKIYPRSHKTSIQLSYEPPPAPLESSRGGPLARRSLASASINLFGKMLMLQGRDKNAVFWEFCFAFFFQSGLIGFVGVLSTFSTVGGSCNPLYLEREITSAKMVVQFFLVWERAKVVVFN